MISHKVFDFLRDVIQNNNREWFQDNKPRYEETREEVIEFAAAVLKDLSKTDLSIIDADPKKAVQRIYRDIRFSKDKTPYKNNFGISFTPKTGKVVTTGYYIHITPGGSFVAGGYWQPLPEHLKAIRQEIDYHAKELKQIVDDKDFVNLFGDMRNGNALKTVPKGYDAENPDISLLKLKDFIAMRKFTDTALLKKDSFKEVASTLAKIHPLNVFLANAIA